MPLPNQLRISGKDPSMKISDTRLRELSTCASRVCENKLQVTTTNLQLPRVGSVYHLLGYQPHLSNKSLAAVDLTAPPSVELVATTPSHLNIHKTRNAAFQARHSNFRSD